MDIIRDLNSFPKTLKPIALTIGNFDGVHLGHRELLKRLASIAKNDTGQSVVITFTNHPSQILRPNAPIAPLCTLDHKIKLLEENGVDILILLEFNKELSQLSAEEFLNLVRKHIPIKHLLLGHDATLGKDRQGNKELVEAYGKRTDLDVEYLMPIKFQGHIISSSLIRNLIKEGNLKMASELLGRPIRRVP